MATNEENSWRTANFRQSVVAKIEEAIRSSGMPTSKNSMEMENHVFQKAKTKEEYLGFVARLILHVREMNSKKNPGMGGPAGVGQNMQDPINALQTLARQGTGNPQMMGLVPPQGPPQVTATNLLQTLNQRPGNQPRMSSPVQDETFKRELKENIQGMIDSLLSQRESRCPPRSTGHSLTSTEHSFTPDGVETADLEDALPRGEKRLYEDWSNKRENKAFGKYVVKSLDKMGQVDAVQAHVEIQGVLAKYSLRKYEFVKPVRGFAPRREMSSERPLGLLKCPSIFKPRRPSGVFSMNTPRCVIKPMDSGERPIPNPMPQTSSSPDYF